jgi:hypothetical protein
MPPDVPPPPPPAAEPAASTTPSAAASDAPFEPTPPPPRSHSVALGFRTGYSIPMGKIDGIAGDRMSNVFTGQVPISFELGWRAIPELVIGGYLGIAIGGVTGDIEKICDANGTDCMAISGRVGFELLYHFLPNGQADPWLGYGIGIEVASFSQKSSVREQTITFTGVELAHFMAGVDFPLSKSFSLGPFVDFALGRYTHVKDVIDDTTTLDADLSNRASHQWLTLGVRGMLLP